jgi:hypothetical protein
MLKPFLTVAALAIVAIAPYAANAAENTGTTVRKILVEPTTVDKIPGKGKKTQFLLKDPERTDTAAADDLTTGTTVLPIVKDPEPADVAPEAADAGPVDDEPKTPTLVQDPEPTEEPADTESLAETEIAPEPTPAEKPSTVVRSPNDLYRLLIARGYQVDVLHRDYYGDYVFLVTPSRGAHGYLLVVDGHRGKVIDKRTIRLADYGFGYGQVSGHGDAYTPVRRHYRYAAADNCDTGYRVSRRTYVGY